MKETTQVNPIESYLTQELMKANVAWQQAISQGQTSLPLQGMLDAILERTQNRVEELAVRGAMIQIVQKIPMESDQDIIASVLSIAVHLGSMKIIQASAETQPEII